MKSLKLIIQAFRDLFIRILPKKTYKKRYGYAFIVHARNRNDIYRKYPFLKILPNNIVDFLSKHMWPFVVSEVDGLKSKKTGKEIKGLVIGILMNAEQMMKDRKLALKKIIDAATLAKKMGVGIIGLGGLTSSLSRGGKDIVDKVDIAVTTGHAYTAYTVSNYVLKVTELFNLDKEKINISIVGASGSIGSTTAQMLAKYGYKNINLVEIPRKMDRLENVINTIKNINKNTNITKSSDMYSIKNSEIIVTATNAPEAVVNNSHLMKGAIIIDDAQPSDVADEVLDNKDVLVLEAGAVHTPGIDTHFNFGLKDKYDNFCCMCEIMVLAANEWDKNYVIERADLNLIEQIINMSDGMGFELSKFQNFKEIISEDHINRIKKIIKSRNT